MEDHAIQPVATDDPTTLNPRYYAAIDAYLDATGPGFGNQRQSAIIAGYLDGPGIDAQATRLFSNDKVRAAIKQRLSAANLTPERVRGATSEVIDGAIQDHSWGAASSILTLAAKITGLTTDGTTINNNLLLPEGLTLDEIRGLAYPQLPAPEITVTDVPEGDE